MLPGALQPTMPLEVLVPRAFYWESLSFQSAFSRRMTRYHIQLWIYEHHSQMCPPTQTAAQAPTAYLPTLQLTACACLLYLKPVSNPERVLCTCLFPPSPASQRQQRDFNESGQQVEHGWSRSAQQARDSPLKRHTLSFHHQDSDGPRPLGSLPC